MNIIDTSCTIPHTVRRQDGSTFVVYAPDYSIPGMAEAVAHEYDEMEALSWGRFQEPRR